MGKWVINYFKYIGSLWAAIKKLVRAINNVMWVHFTRIFWAHVYLCYFVGVSTVGYGGYLSYKQFWLKRTTILIGETNVYDDGSTDERVEFSKRKGEQ